MRGVIIALAVTILMPVAAFANDPWMAVPVPATTLYPGDHIQAERLAERRYRKSYVARAALAVTAMQVDGKRVLVTIPRGRPIPLSALGAPFLVRKGEPVQAVVRMDGLEISARLVAIADGGAGDTVRLRNPETGAIIEGLVGEDGTVGIVP